jgi:hypothetical protein
MEDMEDDEVAAAMGFSSFGGTKRKYDQTTSAKAKADVSGANTTRLGVRSKAQLDTSQRASNHASESEACSHATESQQAPAKNKTNQIKKQPPTGGLASFLSRGRDLPERPTMAEENDVSAPPPRDNFNAPRMVSFGGPAIPEAELAALRNGVVDENGDKAYFLPSFVEDPWEKPSSRSK